MASRPPHLQPEPSAEKPVFTFHLLYKEPAQDPSHPIGGAIIAGPVGALFSQALAAALGEAEETNGPTKHPPSSIGGGQKPGGHSKAKRRRRTS